jgi:peroxiredoxin
MTRLPNSILRLIRIGALIIGGVTGTAQDHDALHGTLPESERALFSLAPFRLAERITATDEVSFPITTDSPETQAFFNQGLAFLYGGWPQEAERSFQTASLADPDALMPQWGVALSRLLRDPSEAGLWLDGLVESRKRAAPQTALETALLAALPTTAAVQTEDANSWRSRMHQALRSAIVKLPRQVELKAILASLLSDGWHPWLKELDESPDRVLSLIADVAAARPDHPAPRFGLRLWANGLRHDPYHTKKKYFDSKNLGLSPAFAAHWSLAGRYLAERGNFGPALQYSEMAVQIQHRWAERKQLAPDQLPDYARHRAAQTRQFQSAGNAQAAVAIAHELLRLPRHPVWNALTNSFGSAYQGRRLLLGTYRFFGQWRELAAALRDGRIPALDDPLSRAEHTYATAIAAYFLEDKSTFTRAADRLNTIAFEVKAAFAKQPRENTVDSDDPHHGNMLQWLRDGGEDLLAVTEWNRSLKALNRFHTGATDEAAAMLSGSRRVPDLLRSRLLWSIGRQRDARQALLNTAQLPLPMRVQAMKAGTDNPDRFPIEPKIDPTSLRRARRPGALSQLGLSSWQPTPLQKVSIPRLDGSRMTNRDLLDRHTVLILVYSSTCSHCVEQLDALREAGDALAAADLEVCVVAGEPAASLSAWLTTQQVFPAKFSADPEHRLFHELGAYDDFNDMPLHATIYVDPTGRVLWKDIGYSPFTDIRYLVKETRRLRQAYPVATAD